MRFIEIVVEGKGSALAEIDEVYFDLLFAITDENPSPQAEAGDVSYWTPGSAFCIFYGGSQPYSAVNHVGRIFSGLDIFPGVEEGDQIVLRRGEA